MSRLSAPRPINDPCAQLHQEVKSRCLQTHCAEGPDTGYENYGPDGGSLVRIKTCGIGCRDCIIESLRQNRDLLPALQGAQVEFNAWGDEPVML